MFTNYFLKLRLQIFSSKVFASLALFLLQIKLEASTINSFEIIISIKSKHNMTLTSYHSTR